MPGDEVVVGVSAIVWFELMFGASKSTKRSEVERRRLRTFAGQLEVLPLDLAACEAAAAVRAQLEAVGKPIGSYDTLIAGHALALSATLVTHNTREFSRVRGLKLADWAS